MTQLTGKYEVTERRNIPSVRSLDQAKIEFHFLSHVLAGRLPSKTSTLSETEHLNKVSLEKY